MKHNYNIVYGRIRLRPLEKGDIEKLRILRNKERQFFINSNVISKESQIKWFENYCTNENDIMFAVEKIDQPGIFIGTVAIHNIDWGNKIGEFGRTLIDKSIAPEPGLGTEATIATCFLGFEQIKLTKILGRALINNERIIKVDVKAGFKITGESEGIVLMEMTRETLNV